MLNELREMDERLRSLREKVESGDKTASVARTVALLYVDVIARAQAFSAQLDRALEGQLFIADRPFRENVKRARAAMRIYDRLIKMMLEATEGILKCFGGHEVIRFEALARCVAQHPEVGKTMLSALEQQIQRIAKSLAKQSNGAVTKRSSSD